MTYEIFICYKRITAADLAAHLKIGLEELGFRAFLDTIDIPKTLSGSEKWFNFRDQALLESKILLLIVTPGIEKSEEIRKELTLATKNETQIMCLRHVDVSTDIEIDLGFRKLNLRELNQIPFDTKEDLLRKTIFNLGRKAPAIPVSRPSYIALVVNYPPPSVDFRITQIVQNNPRIQRELPDVGFNLRNFNNYPIKAKVKARVYLGSESLGFINSGYYNGKTLWNLNPYHTVFGHFSVPNECVGSMQKLSIQVDLMVLDPNGYEYEFLPVSWSYMREENNWFFEPGGVEHRKESDTLGRELHTDKKAELRNRIKEDLMFLKKQITRDLEKEAFQSRAFPIDVFVTLRKDLVLALSIETFRTIQETYAKIESLRFPSNLRDINMKSYKEAIDLIDKTIVKLT